MHIITAYRIQLSACLKSCKGSQFYNRFWSYHGHYYIFRRWCKLNFRLQHGSELTKKFIQQLPTILFYNNFKTTKKEEFSISKFESSKLIISYLKRIQQSRFEYFVNSLEIYLAEHFVQKNYGSTYSSLNLPRIFFCKYYKVFRTGVFKTSSRTHFVNM